MKYLKIYENYFSDQDDILALSKKRENDFVQEVNITAKIVSGDINVTLPDATATNKGQVVNIKIVNTVEVADYLNILVGSTTLTYGALPYQSWIIKSNGSTWEVVGRN